MDQRYGGIDLHANNSVIALLDEHDHVVWEKRLPNEIDTIFHHLSPYHQAIRGLAVESTYNWYWLVDALVDTDYRVRLANTAAMKQVDPFLLRNLPFSC